MKFGAVCLVIFACLRRASSILPPVADRTAVFGFEERRPSAGHIRPVYENYARYTSMSLSPPAIGLWRGCQHPEQRRSAVVAFLIRLRSTTLTHLKRIAGTASRSGYPNWRPSTQSSNSTCMVPPRDATTKMVGVDLASPTFEK